MLTLKAPAKLNLALEVLGRRSDGYHDVVTVLQTLDLLDTVTLEPAEALTLECDDPSLPNEENLAWRAALLLRQAYQVTHGARIRLQKAIPQAAGLGGGSSDAAAVLRGLNTLWGLGLSLQSLAELGATLGSDVPFFIYGGTALARGRGEAVEPLPPAQLPSVVLLCPPVPVPSRKTTALYSSLTPVHFTRGILTRKLAGRIRGQGDVPLELLFNTFDAVAWKAYPGLEMYWRAFQELGAPEVHLCGSGPAMFTLLRRPDLAIALRAILVHARGWAAYLVNPLSASDL